MRGLPRHLLPHLPLTPQPMKGTLPSDSTEKTLAVATRDRSAANTSGDVLISTAGHFHVRNQQQPQKDARNAERALLCGANAGPQHTALNRGLPRTAHTHRFIFQSELEALLSLLVVLG